MNAVITYSVKVLNDQNEVKLYEPRIPFDIEKSNLSEFGGPIEIRVAGGATDVVQSLANVDNANLLLILTTEDITIKKNSSAGEAWNIISDKVTATEKKGILLITTNGITSLYLSNSGTETAVVTLIFAS